MKTTLASLLALSLVCGAFAQDDAMKKHEPRAVKTSETPVSQSEARSTFVRAETVMRKVLGMPATTKSSVSIPSGAKAVTRAQVVAELNRLYQTIRPKVKVTPRPVSFDASVVRFADAKQKANLLALVKMGAVAKLGPIVTGSTETLTVPQFGDAVGFFMSRMAYMTHLPSTDWTGSIKKY